MTTTPPTNAALAALVLQLDNARRWRDQLDATLVDLNTRFERADADRTAALERINQLQDGIVALGGTVPPETPIDGPAAPAPEEVDA